MSTYMSKRLAGPGFYLNVRFDKDTVTRNRGTKTPYSDDDRSLSYEHHQSEELFDIKEGEILISKKNGRKARSQLPHVFSSLNGFPKSGKVDPLGEMLDESLFIGVAQTEHKASSNKSGLEQGLVAVVSGVVTVMNESKQTIHPGDLLYLGLPTGPAKQKGVPQHKMRYCFTNRPKFRRPSDAEFDEIVRLRGMPATDKNNNRLRNFLMSVSTSSNPPCIAKALSFATHGQRMDVLLHPRQTPVAYQTYQ